MKTILVIDDEYAIVEVLAELLQDEGYRVLSAANGKDGLARLEKENPDLVIVDFMMPIGDGRELVERMRALPAHQSTPIVMMSSATQQIALSNGLGGKLEVSAFLRKPFKLDSLLETVNTLIGTVDQDDPARLGRGTIH